MKAVTLIREPNKVIPKAFRDALLLHTTALGYASPQGNSHVDNEILPGDEFNLAEVLDKLEANYKNDRVFYHLMEAEEGDVFNFHSLQPFNLLTEIEGDTTKTLLSVMLEGEFPKYNDMNQDGESFSPEYHVVNSVVKPLIDELWDIVSGDIEMLMRTLDKKTPMDKLKECLGPRASITFIPCKGPGKVVTNIQDGGSWDWGKSTRTLGYEEKPSAEAKQPDKAGEGMKKLNLREQALAKAKASAAATVATDNKSERTAPAGGTNVKSEQHAEVYSGLVKKNEQFFINNGILWVKPPKGTKYKECRSWWTRHCINPIPEQAPEMFRGFPADALRQDSPLAQLRLTFIKGETKQADQKQANREEMDEQSKQAEAKKESRATLFIPKEQKERWLALRKSGKIKNISREELQARLREYPPASVQLGENLADILQSDPEGVIRAAHDVGGHTMAMLLLEAYANVLDLDISTPETKEGEQPDVEKEKKEGQPPAPTDKKLSLRDQALKKVATA